jgi:hypothetical protein
VCPLLLLLACLYLSTVRRSSLLLYKFNSVFPLRSCRTTKPVRTAVNSTYQILKCPHYPPCKSHPFCAALCCHLWPVWFCHIFILYFINGTIFGKKNIVYKMCVLVLVFSTASSQKCFILRKPNEMLSQMYVGLHVQYRLWRSDCNET